MSHGTPATLATTTAIPQPRTTGRFALAALAALFIASAGPASASAPADDGELATAGDGSHRRAAERELRRPTHPWLHHLDAFVDAVIVNLDEVGASTDKVAAQPDRREKRQRPRPGPFSMNLYSKGDFVNQKTAYWCIPASTQSMMNMMDRGRPDRSRKLQARLYRVGDNLEEDGSVSDERELDRYRGMGISEWAGLLNRYDHGPYGLRGYKSLQNALRNAARMMRKTRKPVGLVVWRGAHAWVMSGFSATADPARTGDFRVTSVVVHDPWFPRVSSFWGRSRGPNARVTRGSWRRTSSATVGRVAAIRSVTVATCSSCQAGSRHRRRPSGTASRPRSQAEPSTMSRRAFPA